MSNAVLQRQKNEKNDEYYTRYEDIEAEVLLYRKSFEGAVVYCPCDAPWSNFYKFFIDRFHELNLKRLICTSLGGNRFEYDGKVIHEMAAGNDGDFRKNEIPKDAIVCTNPPFSLFMAFRDWCGNHKVLVIGNQNALFYKNIWNTGWHYGQYFPTKFTRNGITANCGGLFCWITNMEPDVAYKRKTVCFVPVNPEKHKEADNYRNTINCDTSKEIPDVYEEIIAVPKDTLKYDLSGFSIIGITKGFANGGLVCCGTNSDLQIGERKTFLRILLKRKKAV